jgi:hypothetical protein
MGVLESETEGEGQWRRLAAIASATTQMERLVDDLLLLARQDEEWQRVAEAITGIDGWIGSPGLCPAAARPVLSLAALPATRPLAGPMRSATAASTTGSLPTATGITSAPLTQSASRSAPR